MYLTFAHLAIYSGLAVSTFGQVTNQYYIPLQQVVDCLRGDQGTFNQLYDISNLTCRNCAQNNTFQRTSQDGLSCECRDAYKIVRNTGAADVYCEACPTGYVTSSDGWGCVVCDTGDDTLECVDCSGELELTAERLLNGAEIIDAQNNATRTCKNCTSGISPSHPGPGDRCVRCDDTLRVQDGTCDCPQERFTGGICFNTSTDLEPDYVELYFSSYGLDTPLTSVYFQENLRAAHGLCSSRPDTYGNLTACQMLANMCVLLMYTEVNGPPTQATCGRLEQVPCNDACSLHRRFYTDEGDNRLETQPTGQHSTLQWTANMPWLFYGDNTDNINLRYTTIPTSFSAGDTINITAEVYSMEGNFEGTINVLDTSDLVLSVCPFLQEQLREIFQVGKKYTKTCNIKVNSLFEDASYETVFYDLNLPYFDPSAPFSRTDISMYAIPLLVTNYQDINSQFPNSESSEAGWQLTRRLFLVDRVSGVETSGSAPSMVRYLKTSKLFVTLQDGNNQGRIYPPYMELEYDIVSADQYNTSVQITFEVHYKMSLNDHSQDMSIASGVMAALGVVYAAFMAGNWNRRQGKIAIDCTTLLVFFAFLSGSLACSFFVVNFGFSFWWLLLYKMEDTVILVPEEGGESFLRAFIGATFALQLLNVAYLCYEQCTVDIFFLDWERPRSSSKTLTEQERRIRKPTQNDGKVSVWRRLFVANEWNELQNQRKISIPLLLIVTLLLLEVVGIKNLARFDTSSSLSDTDEVRGDYSKILRFAVGCVVYIGVALVLWIFHNLIWGRFVNNRAQNFVDLCSLCNVSVIVLTHDQFGYYIHGRTVHGFGDMNLKQMHQCLKREELNLCSDRGLDQSEQQTFEILLPKLLRMEYDRALKPYLINNFQRRDPIGRVREDIEEKLNTYSVINRFFQKFIDHNLNRLNYVIVDKTWRERLLQTEIQTYRDIAYFYTDNGTNSFTNALFLGNELPLQLLLLSTFTLVDLLGINYVLAAVLTYILNMILTEVRESLGKRNLQQKSLTDERFLI